MKREKLVRKSLKQKIFRIGGKIEEKLLHPNIKLEKFGKSFVKKFCIQKLKKKKKTTGELAASSED